MDRELSTALRAVRASGRAVELIKMLLDDMRLGSLQEVANHTNLSISNWRDRQIERALEMDEEKLKQFKMIAANARCDHTVPITDIENVLIISSSDLILK